MIKQQEDKSSLTIAFATKSIPDDIVSMEAILTRDNYSPVERSFNVQDDISSTTFESVEVGTWTLTVNAFDANSLLIYQGTKSVEILAGQQVAVDIAMERVDPVITGNLVVNVVFNLDTYVKYYYDFNSGDLDGWHGNVVGEIEDCILHVSSTGGILGV